MSTGTHFIPQLRSVSSCTKISCVGGNEHSYKRTQCIRRIYDVLHQIVCTEHHLLGLFMSILPHVLIKSSLLLCVLVSRLSAVGKCTAHQALITNVMHEKYTELAK